MRAGPSPLRRAWRAWSGYSITGADPELLGAWPSARALVIAAFSGRPEFVDCLRRKGARVDGFTGAALGEKKAVAKALEDPAFANARDGGVLTALHCAAGSALPARRYAIDRESAARRRRRSQCTRQIVVERSNAPRTSPPIRSAARCSNCYSRAARTRPTPSATPSGASISSSPGSRSLTALNSTALPPTGKPLLNDPEPLGTDPRDAVDARTTVRVRTSATNSAGPRRTRPRRAAMPDDARSPRRGRRRHSQGPLQQHAG